MARTREEILEEWQRLQGCRPYVFGEFRSILLRHNPLGINFETKGGREEPSAIGLNHILLSHPHTYDPAVVGILSSLSPEGPSGPEDFGRIVHEAFVWWLDKDTAGTRERYSAIGAEMWQFFQGLRAKVAAIEANLVGLNPVLLQFCSRHGFGMLMFWPGRSLCLLEGEISQSMDLTLDAKVDQELLDRGFHPDLQWSLDADAWLELDRDPERHQLSRPVFEHWSYSRFFPILADTLESGLDMLNGMNEVEIRKHGRATATVSWLPPSPGPGT